MSAAFHAFLVAAPLTALLECMGDAIFGKPRRNRQTPQPALALGILGGITVMALRDADNYAPLNPGAPNALAAIFFGLSLLFIAGLRSDVVRPRSLRHAAAAIGAGLALALGGIQAPFIGIPGTGHVALGAFVGTVFTIAWVFVVVGVLEVCSMLPFIAGGIAGGLSLLSLTNLGAYQNYPGMCLAGVILGALAGRTVGGILRVRERAPDKAEVLVVGGAVAALTLCTFLKSITLSGLLIPFGILAVLLVIAGIQGFDRGIILRANPRG